MSRAAQLLGCSQSGRTRTHYGSSLPAANLRRLGTNPAFQKSALHDIFFVLLDRNRRLSDAQHARGLTWRGANTPREFREIVGRVQLADGILPASAVHKIVPVGDEVADGAPGLAEGNAAIH